MTLTRLSALIRFRNLLGRLKEKGSFRGNPNLVSENTYFHELCFGEGAVDFDLLFEEAGREFNVTLETSHLALTTGSVRELIDALVPHTEPRTPLFTATAALPVKAAPEPGA